MNENCLIWEKTEIIDLPFYPFDLERDVVTRMINESAKYIKYIKNEKFRLSREEKEYNNKKFFFYKTDTLIGVDISILEPPFQSYLDELYFVLKMYPMVFINSHIDAIKTITLQSYCLNNYYILPVFDTIPFLDKAATKKYSKVKLEELIKGEIEQLQINDFLEVDSKISLNELKNRFPQFNILENGNITFRPKITWLGVSDNELERLLNHLFNNNITEFKVPDILEKFDINQDTLLNYINSSMLFHTDDNINVIFRLIRKHIYWGFVCNLANQLEQEMIERDAICYELAVKKSINTEKKVTERIYHKIGKLFEKRDSFSYKLFSILKRQIEVTPDTYIVIVDNGNMDEIISMLVGMDLQNRVLKILDYFGEAVTFPDVDYNVLNNQNIIVVIDVINTGKLIKSVIDLLVKLNGNRITIFSYIVNEDFSFESLKISNEIKGYYLTEKKLYNVEDIFVNEYEERFTKDADLNFRMLWGDVGKNIQLSKFDSPFFNDIKKLKEKCDYNFLLKGCFDKHSYIYQKVKRLLKGFNLIFIDTSYVDIISLVEQINQNEMQGKLHIEKISGKNINIFKLNKNYNNKKAFIIMPMDYIETNVQLINRFMSGNDVIYWRYLSLVDCELYSLEEDDKINNTDDNVSVVFYSKLKKYIAKSNNLQL